VGVGDALGQFDRTNLLRVVRADGVIVKPDDSITPLDSAYIAQANNRGLPLLAAAQTRHDGSITSYVFAFGQTAEQRTASFLPSVLGYKGPVYAYNYFDKRGMYVEPWQAVEFVVPDNGAYWIVVPVGASGVGFLGDAGKFVSNGRNRVAHIRDTGTLAARVVFSAGERRLHLYGFSLVRPAIQVRRAAVENLAYDSRTQLFHFDLVAKPGTSPVVTLWAYPKRASPLKQGECLTETSRDSVTGVTRVTNPITMGILAVTRAAETCDRCDNSSHACRGGGLSVGEPRYRFTRPAEMPMGRPLCLSETYALKYWWCSPPRTGIASGRPTVWTARGTGASLCSDRCVRASL
jgi:hypothetical protein